MEAATLAEPAAARDLVLTRLLRAPRPAVWRCWTEPEVRSLAERHGFRDLECFGAYDPALPAGTTDRLVVVAQKGGD